MPQNPDATADFKTEIQCKNGQQVIVEINDSSYMATVHDQDGQEIGSMEFYEVEGPALKLAWAYLDKQNGKYVHQGIGRQILKLVSDRYGFPIVAESNDGIQKDDGSHLTGDAPAFVAKMRAEGLIARSDQDDDP